MSTPLQTPTLELLSLEQQTAFFRLLARFLDKKNTNAFSYTALSAELHEQCINADLILSCLGIAGDIYITH